MRWTKEPAAEHSRRVTRTRASSKSETAADGRGAACARAIRQFRSGFRVHDGRTRWTSVDARRRRRRRELAGGARPRARLRRRRRRRRFASNARPPRTTAEENARDRFSSVTRRDVALALALARRSRRSSPSTPSLGGDVSPVRVARGAPLRSPARTCRPLRILGRSRAPALERRSRGATSSSTMSSRRMNARVHE